MIENDSLFVNLNVHLKSDIFKSFHDRGSHILDVVVANDEGYPAIELVQDSVPCHNPAKGKIPQVEYHIVFPNHSVPVVNQRSIHLYNVLEWAIAELNDVCMAEMSVGCKEHPLTCKPPDYFKILCHF